MPFRSQAQRRWMHAAAARGEIPKSMPRRWEAETPKGRLPERVKKTAAFVAGATMRESTAVKRGNRPTVVVERERTLGPRDLAGGEAEKSGTPPPDPRQLAMGRKIEREHTRRPAVAEEIARDHLAEIPDYYTRLKRMEDEAKTMGKKTASFVAGALTKLAEYPEDLGAMQRACDSRTMAADELSKITDPAERQRYLADMSARNHPLTMALRRGKI